MSKRRKSKKIKVGNIFIGGDAPISIQSMTNTPTSDVDKTISQIYELEEEGCDIVRVAVPDMKAAKSLKEIKENISIPLIADIHFDYRLALEAAKWVDKIRINPGNIEKQYIRLIVDTLKEYDIPVRIGVNSGSLEKDIEERLGRTPEAAVESALRNISFLEEQDFYNIIISLKFSDVDRTIRAYKLISNKIDYPLHLGVTEAGLPLRGIIKSSLALGELLKEGIGDTIRISLTAPPVEEIKVAKTLLNILGLRKGINIISCPTCGRIQIDLIKVVNELEKRIKEERLEKNLKRDINISVLGCVVNGIGEGKEADIGLAGGAGVGIIFKQGKIIKKVEEKDMIEELIKELKNLIKEVD